MEKVRYLYANRYYDDIASNAIWRTINTNSDVEKTFNGAINIIEYFSNKSGGDMVREDTEDMEKRLANIEIAINRVIAFPERFSYSVEEVEKLKERYKELAKKVHDINYRRVCWD
jgi:chromosome segregation ATPase